MGLFHYSAVENHHVMKAEFVESEPWSKKIFSKNERSSFIASFIRATFDPLQGDLISYSPEIWQRTWKWWVSNRNLLFEGSIFRFHVSFRGRQSFYLVIFWAKNYLAKPDQWFVLGGPFSKHSDDTPISPFNNSGIKVGKNLERRENSAVKQKSWNTKDYPSVS